MILDKIVEATKVNVAKAKEKVTFEHLKAQVSEMAPVEPFRFEKALRQQDFHFICEVKKASPSKGIIAEDFPYVEIAKEYEKAGAAAISVLTEPDFFKGSPQYLQEIAKAVRTPLLRKDFVIDEYQIYEAKLWGASAVLLICAILDEATLRHFHEVATDLGLSCLVEAHDEEEIKKALAIGAHIIGVNNRNLKDFTVNVKNSLALRRFVPDHLIFVSESGIETPADIEELRRGKVSVALIGETFMRSPNKIKKLAELHGHKPKRPKIKICGIKHDVTKMTAEGETIALLDEADYIGFVMAPSKRRISPEEAAKIRTRGKRVGVFVNEELYELIRSATVAKLDVVQLHGDEDDHYIDELRKRWHGEIWQAFAVKDVESIKKANQSGADKVLLDAYHPAERGGTGETFNWELLQGINRPYILAGGLSSKNIAIALRSLQPHAIDISSGLEENGEKSATLIEEFFYMINTITK